MNEQTDYIGFEASEFADNPEPRVACVLLLDVSGSMEGAPIAELNDALLTFKGTLLADSLASKRAEVAIVTFGGCVQTVQDFATVDRFYPPTLTANGDTPMGQAIQTGIDLVATRKQTYKSNSITYYRPWIFLITDGEPTDSWESVAEQIRKGEESQSFTFFAVGVESANLDILAKISKRTPLKLKGIYFRELFLWLSKSMQQVSQSSPGDKVRIAPLDWSEI